MATLKIPVHQLTRIIRTVAPAASTDGDRPIMTGVLFETTEFGNLTVVATDSYRLYQVELADKIDGDSISAIIPARWLLHWATGHLDDSNRFDLATLTVDGTEVNIETGLEQCSTRILQGDFPSGYKQLLAAEYPMDVQSNFNARYICAALEAATTWSDKPLRTEQFHSSRPCKFTVDDQFGRLDMLVMPVRV